MTQLVMRTVTVLNTEMCGQVSLNTDYLQAKNCTGTNATRWVTQSSLMACLKPHDVHML